MKHCVIMTVYTDVTQVNRFISTLPEDWDIYIHLDKKSEIAIKDINPKAYVIKRYNIYWGSFKHVSAFMHLLDIACQKDRYDYYHLITGQDFWAKSHYDIMRNLNGDNIYVDIVSDPTWYNGGYDIYAYDTLSRFCDIRIPLYRRLNKVYKTLQDYLGLKRKKPKYAIYGGSVYCSLTNEAVKECLDSPIADDLLHKLKYSSIGEEIFFQTILMNSRLRTRIVKDNLRYIDWSGEVRPKVLTADDFVKINESNAVFCRKVDSRISSELIDKIIDYYDLDNNTDI